MPDSLPAKPLILCLGNEIISDDGFGAVIAERLNADAELIAVVDVIFAAVAGFALIDLLKDRPRALILDTIQTIGGIPGTLHQFSADLLVPGKNLTTSHQISLPTAIELGKRLGANMPENIDILAVEASDLTTLSESLTPAIEAAVPEAIRLVREWVLHQESQDLLSARSDATVISLH